MDRAWGAIVWKNTLVKKLHLFKKERLGDFRCHTSYSSSSRMSRAHRSARFRTDANRYFAFVVSYSFAASVSFHPARPHVRRHA